LPGTPAAFNASTIDCARESPRLTAADWASGSLETESPNPVTAIVPLPRRAANAFTSSAAGADRLEAPSTKTIVADTPAAGDGIALGAIAGAGGAGAAAGRAGGAAGKAGCDPASGTAVTGGVAVAGAADGGVPAGGVAAGGASNGALCTAFRGAGAGGVAG